MYSSKDFPELKVNSSKIVETIKTEEIKYLKTLGKGIELIDDHLETKLNLMGRQYLNFMIPMVSHLRQLKKLQMKKYKN